VDKRSASTLLVYWWMRRKRLIHPTSTSIHQFSPVGALVGQVVCLSPLLPSPFLVNDIDNIWIFMPTNGHTQTK
jgi:hypothetical protein